MPLIDKLKLQNPDKNDPITVSVLLLLLLEYIFVYLIALLLE